MRFETPLNPNYPQHGYLDNFEIQNIINLTIRIISVMQKSGGHLLNSAIMFLAHLCCGSQLPHLATLIITTVCSYRHFITEGNMQIFTRVHGQ